MKNKIDRQNLSDILMKETYGLKPRESAFFIGALISNLSHNLPEEVADQIIASFKESRETVRDIVKSFKESE
jgi:hypothetical protein